MEFKLAYLEPPTSKKNLPKKILGNANISVVGKQRGGAVQWDTIIGRLDHFLTNHS